MQWKLPALAAALLSCPAWVQAAYKNWPSYNNTLTSERYATLDAVDSKNAAGLKVLCSFDTGEQVSFQTGLVEVDGALFATTEHDTFSIDANTCKQNWRTHEEFASGALKVNRGLAWLDGRVFRGTADGRVRRSRHRLRCEERQSSVVDDHCRPGKRRVGAGISHRLERPRVHRQCRWGQ